MGTLKSIFPLSFSKAGSLVDVIIGVIIYLVVGAIAGFVIGILAGIPILGVVCGLIGSLVDIYCLAGIVILILVFLNVLK